MPNTTVPAADTGLPNLNRRSALAKLGVGAAAGAALIAPVTPQASEIQTHAELTRLIEAHRLAAAEYSTAGDAADAADQAYRRCQYACDDEARQLSDKRQSWCAS